MGKDDARRAGGRGGAARAAAERGIVTRARKVVEIWNARSDLFFYPTIGAAPIRQQAGHM